MDAVRPVPGPEFILRGHTESVSAISCPAEDEFTSLLSGTSNGSIWLWEMKTRRPVLKFQMNDVILGTKYIGCDKFICHSKDGAVKLFDKRRVPTAIDEFLVEQGTFCPIAAIKNGDDIWVASAVGHKSQIAVINWTTKAVISQLRSKENLGMVMQIKLYRDAASDATHLSAGYEDGSVILWVVNDNTELCKICTHNEPVMALDVNDVKRTAAVGSATSKLSLVQFPQSKGGDVLETASFQLKTEGIGCVAFRHDRKILAAGSWNGRISLFGSNRLKPLASMKYHDDTINALCFWPDGRFAAACKDRKISLWSLYRL